MSGLKKVYISGGYGTESSLDIARKLFTEHKKDHLLAGDFDCVSFILDSSPGKMNHMNVEQCEEALIETVKRIENLQNFEKDNIFYTIICCNTMHQVIDANKKLVSTINLVNLIDATVENALEALDYDRNVILWSTKSTYNSSIYHKRLEQHNILVNKDNIPHNCDIIDSVIMDIKRRNYNDAERKALSILSNYDKSLIILGCTELSLIKENLLNYISDHGLDIVIVDCNISIVRKVLKYITVK